jgi:hypothetical protein
MCFYTQDRKTKKDERRKKKDEAEEEEEVKTGKESVSVRREGQKTQPRNCFQPSTISHHTAPTIPRLAQHTPHRHLLQRRVRLRRRNRDAEHWKRCGTRDTAKRGQQHAQKRCGATVGGRQPRARVALSLSPTTLETAMQRDESATAERPLCEETREMGEVCEREREMCVCVCVCVEGIYMALTSISVVTPVHVSSPPPAGNSRSTASATSGWWSTS